MQVKQRKGVDDHFRAMQDLWRPQNRVQKHTSFAISMGEDDDRP